MNRDVTIVTPTIPARATLLARALRSVCQQAQPAAGISVRCDLTGAGSGPTRTAALRAATSTWVAFLDDDDELRPEHLARLLEVAEDTGADVIVPWFVILDAEGRRRPEWDPWAAADAAEGLVPRNERQYDRANPHIFPITCLVRNEVAQEGTFPAHVADGWGGDDFAYWCQLADAGARFHQIPDVTWYWWHHGRNTSGLAAKAGVMYA